MITDRDLEILKFLNIYGRTFTQVLGRTFFNSEQQARNRINKLAKGKIIRYMATGLISPRNAIALSSEMQKYFIDIGIEPKKAQLSMTTIEHNIIEQITHFWLLKIGEVERTSVAKHGSKMHHVPDMILTLPNGSKIFVEIEMQKKSKVRYEDIFNKFAKDNPAQVLYVLPKKEAVSSLAYFVPNADNVRFIDIDTLIENVRETGKVGAKLQREMVEEF